MKTVELHPGAQTDYDESFDWYAARSRQAAMLFATAVDESLGRIQRDPSLFHALDSQPVAVRRGATESSTTR